MISVNKQVLRELEKYDSKLYIKWNNKDQNFEVWRKMPWGDRIITPVVQRIYGGRSRSFCPLDMRLMSWLYGADSARIGIRKNWKWMRKQNMAQELERTRRDTIRQFKGIAQDNYNLVNSEMQGMCTYVGDSNDDWVKPDNMHSRSSRVGTRTAANAREFFGDDE